MASSKSHRKILVASVVAVGSILSTIVASHAAEAVEAVPTNCPQRYSHHFDYPMRVLRYPLSISNHFWPSMPWGGRSSMGLYSDPFDVFDFGTKINNFLDMYLSNDPFFHQVGQERCHQDTKPDKQSEETSKATERRDDNEQLKQLRELRDQTEKDLKEQEAREAALRRQLQERQAEKRRLAENLQKLQQQQHQQQQQQQQMRKQQQQQARKQQQQTTTIAALQLPGYVAEELTVTLTKLRLIVLGKHACQCEESCAFKEFERVFNVPKDVDTRSIIAELKDGELRISGRLVRRGDVMEREAAPRDIEVVGTELSHEHIKQRYLDSLCAQRKQELSSRKVTINQRTGAVLQEPQFVDDEEQEVEAEDDSETIFR